MTIIILEGVNGVGKSVRAATLSQKFDIPIVRLWRDDHNVHLGREDGGVQARLRRMGIPANSWIEDVIITETLVAAQASAILDRSLPSGVAYGTMYGEATDTQSLDALNLWAKKLSTYRGDVVYLYLTAEYETVEERLKGRWFPGRVDYEHLQKWYRHAFRLFPGKKALIRTDGTPSEGIKGELLRAIATAE